MSQHEFIEKLNMQVSIHFLLAVDNAGYMSFPFQ